MASKPTTNYAFTRVSGNRKIGPMSVTSTDRASCPPTCSFKGSGCYAENFPLSIHWSKLDTQGLSIDALCGDIRALPKGSMLRLNQAGDLAHTDGHIDPEHLTKLVGACKKVTAFGYTHHKPGVGQNAELIKAANDDGVTLNLSAESLKQADEYADLGIAPVVVVVPLGTPKVTFTPAGRQVTMCPAYTSDITCSSCGICAVPGRRGVIAFEAHGATKGRIQKVVWAAANT